jgi:hypothetical protein
MLLCRRRSQKIGSSTVAEICIEPFDPSKHRRTDFDCGKPALDEFLRSLVTQYEKRRLGKTFVAVRAEKSDTVVGYYTLAAGAVAFQNMPQEIAKKLPRHPVPVILSARLPREKTNRHPRKRHSAFRRASSENRPLWQCCASLCSQLDVEWGFPKKYVRYGSGQQLAAIPTV